MSQKHQVHVASYVIFRRDDKILLMRRANTGYEDGKYSLPSGHIEAGEFPDAAAIREAQEEVGVKIQDLRFKQVLYSDDNYVCFFFETTKWDGEIRNCEEDKCDDLNWFDLNNLPKNIAPEVKTGLENFLQKRYYSNQKIKQS
jgi:mutator protein MutT